MAKSEIDRLEIVEDFVRRVNERAETNMLKTGKLEGAHYAAMAAILEEMRTAAQKGVTT